MWIPPDECIVLVIDIENEYATDDIIEVNKENNPIMIRGFMLELATVIYVRKW